MAAGEGAGPGTAGGAARVAVAPRGAPTSGGCRAGGGVDAAPPAIDGSPPCPDSLLQLVCDSEDGKPEVLSTLATVLQQAIDRSAGTPSTSGRERTSADEVSGSLARSSTLFHGQRCPPIGVEAYICRISKYSKCSPVCFAMAFHYMESLARRDERLLVASLNVHRLLLTGVLLAVKLTDDTYFNNAYFAKIGGISVTELNALELEMLRRLDFHLFVPHSDVRNVLARMWIVSRAAAPLAVPQGALPCRCAPAELAVEERARRKRLSAGRRGGAGGDEAAADTSPSSVHELKRHLAEHSFDDEAPAPPLCAIECC